MRHFTPVIAAVLLAATTYSTHAADLTVTVTNIQDGTGQVLVGLFDTAQNFPKDVKQGQSFSASQRDADGKLRVVFAGLAEGTYAVSAIHDKNADGKLSTNLMGIPNEPYGFSGAGGGSFGPPAFKDVSFALPAAGSSLAIAIK